MRPAFQQLIVRVRRQRRVRGFTLVEMMFGLSIGGILLAGILTTYVFSVKAYQAVSNYREIHGYGRKVVDYFSKDMRAVSGISTLTSNSTSTTLSVLIPTSFNTSGTPLTTKTVTYTYNGSTITRYDSSTGYTDQLATNVYGLSIMLYDHVGSNTTLISSAKGVQLDVKLRKLIISQFQTEDFLSARLDMRNK